ncbi:hypothetical protein [Cellulomonas sp. S1-8]|uniref:hypothetical protein n=1 Tax=Cellulomonas sp. S1-8 TaxID=2904790 RepID=UPI002243724D|nr:hypothetical protein [Cellulomonas sp. S1-8]UZN04619.1 hypothetical protein OKX07_06810 [Cellulomonas sp. S1-8]
MHATGTSFVGVRAAQLRATSARGDAPVVAPSPGDLRAERRAHRRRTRLPRTQHIRLAAASGLHRLADALTPRHDGLGHPVR